MSKPNLDAIRARVEAATEGPWWTMRGIRPPAVFSGDGSASDTLIVDGFELSDAEFIAHARQDIPALLAYVEQLESDLDAAAYRAGVTQGRIGQLQTQIKQLENQLDAVRALVGPENESGMISASAIFHTIGTNNQGDRR